MGIIELMPCLIHFEIFWCTVDTGGAVFAASNGTENCWAQLGATGGASDFIVLNGSSWPNTSLVDLADPESGGVTPAVSLLGTWSVAVTALR